MFQESELIEAMHKAKELGRIDDARHLAGVIEQQRTAWSQQNRLPDNSIVNKYGLERAEQMRQEMGGNYNPAEGMGMGEAAAVSVGRGLMDLPQGIMQGWKLLTDPEKSIDLSDGVSVSSPEYDKYTAEKTKELEGFQKVADERPVTATLGRVVGNMASTAPIPTAGGKTAMGRMGNAVMQNAALAGAEFVPEGGDRLQNMMIAGATGGAMQAGFGETSIKAANKIANAKARNLDISDAKKAALEYAETGGASGQNLSKVTSWDDLSDSGAAAFFANQYDQMPLGGAKFRQAQNTAAKREAEAVVNKFLPDGQLEDLHTAVSRSAQNQLKATTDKADEMFKTAYKNLDPAGTFENRTVRQKAQELINKEMGRGSKKNQAVIDELQKYVDMPNGQFSHWASELSDLKKTVRSWANGENSVVKSADAAKLDPLVDAYTDSLKEAAQKIGGKGGQQYDNARKFYFDNVVTYKKGALHQAIKSNDKDKILNDLVGSGAGAGGRRSKDIARQLYAGLDDKGKQTVRYAMLEKSLDRATSEDGMFSPTMFSKMLSDYQNKTDIFFDAKDKKMLDGLNKWMRTIQRSTGYSADVRTGQKGVGTAYTLATGVGLGVDAGTTAATLVTAGALGKLVRTERGRSLLLAYSNLTPDSKQAAQLAQKINAYLARGASLANAQPNLQLEDE